MRHHHVLAILACGMAANAGAQGPIADRLRSVGTKTVAFTAHARAGVCGDGRTSYSDGLGGANSRFFESGNYVTYEGNYFSDGVTLLSYEPWDTRIAPCEPGPVRVIVRVVDNAPSTLRVAVGPLPALGDTILDLGTVSAANAGEYLRALVRGTDGRVSTSAIMPVVLIDSIARWDVLASAVRDTTRLLRYRRRASDLLARAAAATLPAVPNVEDATRSILREAVNSLVRQRQKADDCIPELLSIARDNPHRDARVAALYQLGQTSDPRAVDLFLTMLRGHP